MGKGEGQDAQKEEVMNTLKEVMGISQEDIDFLYATFGEKCLMSVEEFFKYKEIQEKKKPSEQGESVHPPPYAEEKVEASGYQSASGNDCRGGTGRETEMKEVTVIDDENVEKWLVVENGEEIKEHITKYGLKNIRDVLARNLNGWKEKR